jgi:hypothetical protein
MVFLHQVINKIGFKSVIERCEDLLQLGYPRSYSLVSIIESFLNEYLVRCQRL